MRPPVRSTPPGAGRPETRPGRSMPPRRCVPRWDCGHRAFRAPRSRSERLQAALAQPCAVVLGCFEHHVEGLAGSEYAILLDDDPALVARALQLLQALLHV